MPVVLRNLRMTSPAAVALALAVGSAPLAIPAFGATKSNDFGTLGTAPATNSGALKQAAHVMGATTVSAALAISNEPLCLAPGDQSAPVFVPDGNGGGIAVWADLRTGEYDIYAQKIDEAGQTVWAADGVPVTKASGWQVSPAAVSDGAGGVIVVWEDDRVAADPNLYAQRLSASGVALWAIDGVPICSATGGQTAPVVVADGFSGAIASWVDARGGGADLYAQRVSAAGATQWAADGVLVCGASGTQDEIAAVPDGASGALLAWRDLRGAAADIYSQRISASGVAQWTADGVAVCSATGIQEPPSAVTDGAGGMIVAWGDARGANFDIYSQRMNGAGAPQWTSDGVALCAAAGDQKRARLCSDGANGAVVTWEDRRAANADVYAQRVTGAGAPQWTADGVAVCTATGDQLTPSIAADPTGAALITWSDARTPANGADPYVQRVTLAGAVSWAANGVIACDTTGDQLLPLAASDGQGGALLVWRDYRGGVVPDLYGQRVDTTGAIPAQCATTTTLTASSVVTATAPNSFYEYNQVNYYWGGAGVRPSAGTDWDLEIYDGGTFGTTAYPICYSFAHGGSYLSSGVDFVVGDFNTGHTPVGNYAVRATRYSGAGTAQVEWDADIDAASKDCSGGNCGAKSPNNWTGVIDVWDLFLFDNTTYTFDFTRTGADIKMLLFSHHGTTGTLFMPRSAREFEASTNRFTVYTTGAIAPPGQPGDWYGLVFVNDNGVAGTYTAKINTGALTTDVGGEPKVVTGLQGMMPNPARGACRIQFALERPADVSMRVFDMAGRWVGEVPTQHWGAGIWNVAWDGKGRSGRALTAGVYFVEMMVDGQRVGRSRLALLR